MWICLSEKVDIKIIEKELQHLFSSFSLTLLDDLNELSDNREQWPDILCTSRFNRSEFPLSIEFLWWPDSMEEPSYLELAKIVGTKYSCRTIVDGSDYGDDDSPYWSIVFEEGAFYLADDSATTFGDDEDGDIPVKIIRKLDIT